MSPKIVANGTETTDPIASSSSQSFDVRAELVQSEVVSHASCLVEMKKRLEGVKWCEGTWDRLSRQADHDCCDPEHRLEELLSEMKDHNVSLRDRLPGTKEMFAGAIGAALYKCKCPHAPDNPDDIMALINKTGRDCGVSFDGADEDNSPNAYLIKLYPELANRHGDPLKEEWTKTDKHNMVLTVLALNHRFFAALLVGEQHGGANDTDPVVWDVEENKPFRYCAKGYYEQVKPEQLYTKISNLLLEVARLCGNPMSVNVRALEFGLRHPKELAAVVTSASGMGCISGSEWRWPETIVPVANGILQTTTRKLYDHSPGFYFRGVIAVPYSSNAKCPRWQADVDRQMPQDDADLLQRLFGLALFGSNVAQAMTLLVGASGSMKGTIIRVLIGLLGAANCGTLRTDKLLNSFELGRHRHKLLVYGADVPADFLSGAGAQVLKAMTGEDPISPEYKHSNVVPPMEPLSASIMITSNSRLRVRFEGDKEAWRRRVVVIDFKKEISETERIASYANETLAAEGSGILNWGLVGLSKLSHDGWKIVLSDRQKEVRDKLLDESESSVAFAQERLIKSSGHVTFDAVYKAYVDYCMERNWAPETPTRFGTEVRTYLRDTYGIGEAHNIPGPLDREVRGYRGVTLKHEQEDGD